MKIASLGQKLPLLFLGLFGLLPAGFCLEKRPAGDQIVAEVDGDGITLGALNSELERELGVVARSLPTRDRHTLRVRMLQRLIDRRLLLSAAKRKATPPSPEEVAEYQAQMAAKTHTPGVAAPSSLDDRALLEDLQIAHYIREEVFTPPLSASTVNESVSGPHPQVRLRIIELPQSNPDAEQTATAIVAALRQKPSAFAQYARRFSTGIARARGGDLGLLTENQLPDFLAQALLGLQPDEVSDPIENQGSLFIVKLEKKLNPTPEPVEEGFKRPGEDALSTEHQILVDDHLKVLRSRAKIILYLK